MCPAPRTVMYVKLLLKPVSYFVMYPPREPSDAVHAENGFATL